MERMRIIINFKNTPEEIELYESLKRHSSISGYIKDILKGVIDNTAIDKKVSNSNDNDDIYDGISDIIGG
ncbi:hypothetical protein [Clostridium celatum]|uniref:Uncharacterized protein n=1 Tax=Clostridium celatum DSM 1785 TaxID=545697 RepID=L1Q7E7_9CLOT|nr:hypothetical protein [Clostridium celatum]EKY23868.1 hypothetical protein HMPREF0216_02881 [Clostridium celatum DSM 1785]MBP3929381.1 hypothetical protein [Peptostreptococcaceae bacterium]